MAPGGRPAAGVGVGTRGPRRRPFWGAGVHVSASSGAELGAPKPPFRGAQVTMQGHRAGCRAVWPGSSPERPWLAPRYRWLRCQLPCGRRPGPVAMSQLGGRVFEASRTLCLPPVRPPGASHITNVLVGPGSGGRTSSLSGKGASRGRDVPVPALLCAGDRSPATAMLREGASCQALTRCGCGVRPHPGPRRLSATRVRGPRSQTPATAAGG